MLERRREKKALDLVKLFHFFFNNVARLAIGYYI